MNKNTKTKIIDGATFNGNKIYRILRNHEPLKCHCYQKITVRYTDDEIGKTLDFEYNKGKGGRKC